MIWETKQGDTRNALKATLTPVEGSLTDVDEVYFRMADKRYNNVIFRTVNIMDLPDVTVVFTEGEVEIPGSYYGEYKLVYDDGKIETVPKKGYIRITIHPNLEGS